VDVRDYESILIFFSEEEIEELQAAIDKRKRLALDKESLPKLAEQSDYSAHGVEAVFSEVHFQDPAQPHPHTVPGSLHTLSVGAPALSLCSQNCSTLVPASENDAYCPDGGVEGKA
jgi:hypothetical protein